MSKRSGPIVQRVGQRHGEGVALTVTRRESVNVDGKSAVTIAIDLSQAPVPDRKYVADVLGIIKEDESIKLCFGQSKVGERNLRSLLVVHMPFAAASQLTTGNPDFWASLTSYANHAKLTPYKLTDIREEPQQTVALAANIVASSFSSREACLDFYHASAFAVDSLKRGGDFLADPVVRVDCGTSMLVSMHQELLSIQKELPVEREEVL